MKVNYAACAICDSSWGNFWEEFDGTRLFFCCEVCAVQFRNMVDRIKKETGWPSIDSLAITGDRRGRTCRALRGASSFECAFTFNPQGQLRTFETKSGNPGD